MSDFKVGDLVTHAGLWPFRYYAWPAELLHVAYHNNGEVWVLRFLDGRTREWHENNLVRVNAKPAKSEPLVDFLACTCDMAALARGAAHSCNRRGEVTVDDVLRQVFV